MPKEPWGWQQYGFCALWCNQPSGPGFVYLILAALCHMPTVTPHPAAGRTAWLIVAYQHDSCTLAADLAICVHRQSQAALSASTTS